MNEKVPMNKNSAGWSPIARLVIVSAGTVVVLAGLKAASSLLGPVLLAAFLALLISPALNWLVSRGLKKWLSFLVLFTTIIVVGSLVILFVSTSLAQLQENVPVYQQRLSSLTDQLTSALAKQNIDITSLRQTGALNPQTIAKYASAVLSGLLSGLSSAFLILLLLIFMLTEGPTLPPKVRRWFAEDHPLVNRFRSFGISIRAYNRVRAISNLFVGITFTILLLVVGVDAPFLWGFLAFILSYIPTIGLPLAAIPAIFLALLELGIGPAAIVGVGVLIINSISDNIISPRLSAKELELSTLAVFLSFIFWTWLLGITGALLSVPLTVAVKSLLEAYGETSGFSVLLGPPVTESDEISSDKKAA